MPSSLGLPPDHLSRYETEPSSQIAASRKGSGITHRWHQCRRVQASDPGHRYQPPSRFIGTRLSTELGVESRDPIIERLPFIAKAADQLTDVGAEA
jgi:hypothetical protein